MMNNLELRKFVAPEIITGLDARLLITRYLQHFGAKKPMIVTDEGILVLPWYKEIVDNITELYSDLVVFSEVSENPKDFEAMKGAEFFLSHGCDIIIAIGGGSAMDCAKCISIVSTNGGHILEYEGVDEIRLPGPPLICIPTTAGTSADVSQFAIINDTKTHIKKAIISKKVVPDLALIDPVPLMTMNLYLTACTGMDALTHAIEAYVSNAHSPLTDVHALEAIKLIHQNIEKACQNERSIETMYQMMIATLLAGFAFSNASLGAVHAMAHSLGGMFDLPHGECNSILLQHVVEINYDAAKVRFDKIAEVFGIRIDENTKVELVNKIDELRECVHIKQYVYCEEVTDEVITNLSIAALNDPCIITNPKELTLEELRGLYGKILRQIRTPS